jgi:hypothetical protein
MSQQLSVTAMADNHLLTLCMISAWQRLAYDVAHAKAAATQGDQTNDHIYPAPMLFQRPADHS